DSAGLLCAGSPHAVPDGPWVGVLAQIEPGLHHLLEQGGLALRHWLLVGEHLARLELPRIEDGEFLRDVEAAVTHDLTRPPVVAAWIGFRLSGEASAPHGNFPI